MIRARAGLLLVVAFAGFASVKLAVSEYRALRGAAVPGHAPADSLVAYVARFEPLKARVPPGAVVQFVDQAGGDRNTVWARYQLAQYALAPVVIDSLPAHDLVVGHFAEADTSGIGRLADAETLAVVVDFRNGLALFRRRARR